MGKRRYERYADYPTLDKEHLYQGHQACLTNARRLIEDAKLLGLNRNFRAGYLIVQLACEELGKAIWLRIAQTRTTREQWNEWWGDFHSHPEKHAASILAWEQANGRDNPWREAIKRISDEGKQAAKFREQVMYVNFKKNEMKFVSPPEDGEVKKHFEEKLTFTEWLVEWLSQSSAVI